MDGLDCAGCRQRDALIVELRVQVAALERRLAELEARLKTNSSNSSLPPSADPPWAPRSAAKPPTGRRPGGQPGHPGHARPRLPADQVVRYVASQYERCQSSLPAEAGATDPAPRWRQVAELPSVPSAGLSCPNKQAARFCRNVPGVYPALWTFARLEGVEPTNTLAGRTPRPAVIWRKSSFGNHSQAGCRFVERILTTVQTPRLQNRQVLDYLRQAVAAHRLVGRGLALLPLAVCFGSRVSDFGFRDMESEQKLQ